MNDRIRLVLGAVFGGIVQWIVGFLFWGTPLANLAFTTAPEAQNADLQLALARNLTPTGTGTYFIPYPGTPQGTVLHGQGPVALVMFNTHGFPLMVPGALIGGLVLSIVSLLILGEALYALAWRVPDFATRARVVVCAGAATALYFIVGQPTYNFFMPWGYWLYLAVSLVVGFVAGGLVLARWFLPIAPAASVQQP